MGTASQGSAKDPADRTGRRVLVVEDDLDLRDLLVEFLASEGYEVSAAADGERALAEAHARRPDVILLDLMMPVMSGWQFREAQLDDPQLAGVPVVVVSAFDDTLDAAAALRKPYELEDVLETVRRLAA